MKDELSGVIRKKFVGWFGLHPKIYSHLKDDEKVEKKGTKNFIIKQIKVKLQKFSECIKNWIYINFF